MFLKNLVQQNDYKNFAERYLGIDYEDYLNLLDDEEVSPKELEKDYALVQ